jgi:hypothetical protein
MRMHRLLRPFARHALRAAIVSAMAVLAGCSLASNGPSTSPPHYNATRITDEAALGGTYAPVERVAADALASLATGPISPGAPGQVNGLSVARTAVQPLNVLVLSGGGQYAAFAGGILVGWTASGQRPEFDVVTGVSSGAWLAVYAYLGRKYDPNVKRMTSTLRTSEVFPYRPLLSWMRYGSIASPESLRMLIENEFTDECLADIRAAHQAGRRLFIGTMNQRTRRLVIWDLGAIACGPQPDADRLVRKILVAACSIPGIVPPVDFDVEVNGVRYQEEHADGGAVTQAFVRFGRDIALPDPAKPGAKWLAGSNLYAIAGGKLYADTVEGDIGMLTRITSTISGTLYALYRAELWRIYSLCTVSGMKFHHVAVPQEAKLALGSTDFDVKTMHELFDLGHDMAVRGNLWRQTPPGYEAGEEDNPRAGLRFTIP